jgi:SAM-dependent methyltransferase
MDDHGPIVWEDVACPLCELRREEVLLETTGEPDNTPYRLVRCGSCGLGYLNPRPAVESIGRFYPAGYECYDIPTPQQRWYNAILRKLERLVLSHRFGYPPGLDSFGEKLIATLASPWFGPSRDSMTAIPFCGEGRLLDYGCGSGWYLHRMRERGWNVTGMDFSPHAAARVRDHFRIPVHVGMLPHPDVPRESFDAITMGAVLEHVHWPHPVIAGAAQTLRAGGLLVISVPNLASWQHRYFGRDCWSLELPRHLLHFTPATLRKLVEKHGLEVEELRIVGRTSWMRRSFAAARRRQDPRFFVRISEFRGVASLLTRYSAWTQQADCMTLLARKPARSHLSLARSA